MWYAWYRFGNNKMKYAMFVDAYAYTHTHTITWNGISRPQCKRRPIVCCVCFRLASPRKRASQDERRAIFIGKFDRLVSLSNECDQQIFKMSITNVFERFVARSLSLRSRHTQYWKQLKCALESERMFYMWCIITHSMTVFFCVLLLFFAFTKWQIPFKATAGSNIERKKINICA